METDRCWHIETVAKTQVLKVTLRQWLIVKSRMRAVLRKLHSRQLQDQYILLRNLQFIGSFFTSASYLYKAAEYIAKRPASDDALEMNV